MKIIISNASEINFESKIDLIRLIPEGADGYPLNYGQGEGQVLIETSVWGIYSSADDQWALQYEEGLIDFMSLLALSSRIVDKLKREFNSDLVFKIQGMLENSETHEKHTQ